MKGHVDIVKFLTVEKYCDPMCQDSDQNTPLHMAAQNGHIDIVKFLTLEMHCNPTSRNINNATAQQLAAEHKHLDLLHFFTQFDQKCDPNITGELCKNYSCSVWSSESIKIHLKFNKRPMYM